MDTVKVIEIKKSVFASNEQDADLLRKELKSKGVFLLNLMSSPGSGKTTTLVRTIGLLSGKLRMAVMEADIDSDVDATLIQKATGVPSIQLHTGGMCHLDAGMTSQGLENLPPEGLDLIILENVGNLVCPAEFDTGAVKNVMILSVPEGDGNLAFIFASLALDGYFLVCQHGEMYYGRCLAGGAKSAKSVTPISRRDSGRFRMWSSAVLAGTGQFSTRKSTFSSLSFKDASYSPAMVPVESLNTILYCTGSGRMSPA